MHCAVVEMHLPKQQVEKISDLLGHQSKIIPVILRFSNLLVGDMPEQLY